MSFVMREFLIGFCIIFFLAIGMLNIHTTNTFFLISFIFFQADASLGMLEREYLRESLSYVLAIQDVQERIKFEFVETLLGFMSGWLVFYHLGHEVAEDAKEYMTDLQHKVQKVWIFLRIVNYSIKLLIYK